MLVFAKCICLGKQFNFTCEDMPFFREEIKEEIVMNQINSNICPQTSNDQHRKLSHPLTICAFINPSRRNLCFSNVVVSLLLNIPLLRNKLLDDENMSEENQLLTELKRLAKLPRYSKASTIKIRYLTKRKCIQAGQLLQNYSDNRQHDAGEFLISVIEHLFEDSIFYQNFDEQMFGGLYQNVLKCSCGLVTEKEITKLSHIISLDIHGETTQTCLNKYFLEEDIERTCPDCKLSVCQKTTQIIIEPLTLILQLNRYEYDREEEKVKKKSDAVVCSETVTLPGGSNYSLSSAVNHIGSNPEEGHYNIFLNNPSVGKYVLLDDTCTWWGKFEQNIST
jgi:uncharacterized UBP type Zn finger protein